MAHSFELYAFVEPLPAGVVQSVAVLARSFHHAGMAHDTCRALDELPDSLLKDMGIARSEICFVAGPLAARCGALYRRPGGL